MAVVFCVRETEMSLNQEDGNHSQKKKQIYNMRYEMHHLGSGYYGPNRRVPLCHCAIVPRNCTNPASPF